MHFADRLYNAIKQKGSPISVGLDPRLEKIPRYICEKWHMKEKNLWLAAAKAIVEFNIGIIDAVSDLVPVVKPQIAFYEQYGAEGIAVFKETIEYAKSKDLIVIADVKRGDIGSTAEAYANAYLGAISLFGASARVFDADAVTVNPFLGYDSVKPFIDVCKKYEKGIFILVKTSNLSSGDFQDVLSNHSGLSMYEILAHQVESWGADDSGECGYSFVGAVVGATFPKQAVRIRELLPHAFFLVPGYGAQGATVDDLRPCFASNGSGAIINSSRDIIFAYETNESFKPEEYAQASREAVLRMREELKELRIKN